MAFKFHNRAVRGLVTSLGLPLAILVGSIGVAPAQFIDATTGPLGDTGYGRGAAWGDCDNDGDLDLYLSNYGQANKLFRNDGGGTFVDATSGPLGDTGDSNGVAWGDYDNDGDLDLYVANVNTANRLLRNDGGGTFVDATSDPLGDTGYGTGVAWGDCDNDGDLDLYLSEYGSANKLFRNSGDGTFVDATSDPLGDPERGQGVVWGDYDNDGDLDLFLVNSSSSNKLFRNDGDGSFVDVTSGLMGGTVSDYGTGVAWGDYDNDGDLDLYLTSSYSGNTMLRNDGEGRFLDATSGPLDDTGYGTGVAWGDYDNDGDLDLYISNTWNGANKLLRNDLGGTFVDVTSDLMGDTGYGGGVAWGDYDNDGDLDLYLTNLGGANKLFENVTAASGRHWLQVKLRGTSSNFSGIGARVRIVAGGVAQIREISGGSGYHSQNAMVASFGLGSTTVVDSLEVSWPSGVRQDSLSVAVDQQLLIVEPEGTGVQDTVVPTAYRLFPCRPNPFNPTTLIRYDLPEPSSIDISVHDVSGRLVRTLVQERVPAGRHQVVWRGRDQEGRPVASGVYFYSLEAGSFTQTQRMTLLK
jgi:hypothetical protein